MTMKTEFFRPSERYWELRAEETRVLAELMDDELSRITLLRVAQDYEVLAQLAASKQSSAEQIALAKASLSWTDRND